MNGGSRKLIDWYPIYLKLHKELGDKLHLHSYWVGEIKHELIYDDGIHKKEIKAQRYGGINLSETYTEMYNWLKENNLIGSERI